MKTLVWAYDEPTGEHGYGSVGIRSLAQLLAMIRRIKSQTPSASFWWGK